MKLSAVLLATALVTASIPAVAADLVTNGGFEAGNFSGWTVSAGATFVSTSNFEGYNANSGTYFAALGNVGGIGTLSQTFSDTAGQQYELSYFLASNGTTANEFSASIDGNALFDQINIPATGTNAPFPYNEYTFDFTGTGSDTLAFGERDDPNYLALDDVSITSVASPVPEPSSLMLIGTGLAGALGAFRRKVVRG